MSKPQQPPPLDIDGYVLSHETLQKMRLMDSMRTISERGSAFLDAHERLRTFRVMHAGNPDMTVLEYCDAIEAHFMAIVQHLTDTMVEEVERYNAKYPVTE